VTATGTVSEVITPVAFEMGGESSEAESTRYGEGADGLLVISDGGQAPAPELNVGQTVRVTGTVREFEIDEVEEEIGTDLPDSVFTYWANQPVLIATSMEGTRGETTQ
jgi:hypothetical protein